MIAKQSHKGKGD